MNPHRLAVFAVAALLPALVRAEAVPELPVLRRDSVRRVTITCATADAVIRYTLDGQDPAREAGAYLAPIEPLAGLTVKARAFSSDGTAQSAVAILAPEPGATPLPTTLRAVTQNRDWRTYDWAKRHAACVTLVRDRRPDLVFIGDSITHFWGGEPHDARDRGPETWEQYFGKRKVLNLGFGWDRTENVLWRLRHGELDGASPKVAVLLIGTNNLAVNTAQEIAAGIRGVCDEIHSRSPQTKILLLGLFPRGEKPNPDRAKITEINSLIAQFAGPYVTFLQFGPKFLNPDGEMSPDVMNDFLHPTAKGYQIWAEAMEPTLREMLGEPSR